MNDSDGDAKTGGDGSLQSYEPNFRTKEGSVTAVTNARFRSLGNCCLPEFGNGKLPADIAGPASRESLLLQVNTAAATGYKERRGVEAEYSITFNKVVCKIEKGNKRSDGNLVATDGYFVVTVYPNLAGDDVLKKLGPALCDNINKDIKMVLASPVFTEAHKKADYPKTKNHLNKLFKYTATALVTRKSFVIFGDDLAVLLGGGDRSQIKPFGHYLLENCRFFLSNMTVQITSTGPPGQGPECRWFARYRYRPAHLDPSRQTEELCNLDTKVTLLTGKQIKQLCDGKFPESFDFEPRFSGQSPARSRSRSNSVVPRPTAYTGDYSNYPNFEGM